MTRVMFSLDMLLNMSKLYANALEMHFVHKEARKKKGKVKAEKRLSPRYWPYETFAEAVGNANGDIRKAITDISAVWSNTGSGEDQVSINHMVDDEYFIRTWRATYNDVMQEAPRLAPVVKKVMARKLMQSIAQKQSKGKKEFRVGVFFPLPQNVLEKIVAATGFDVKHCVGFHTDVRHPGIEMRQDELLGGLAGWLESGSFVFGPPNEAYRNAIKRSRATYVACQELHEAPYGRALEHLDL